MSSPENNESANTYKVSTFPCSGMLSAPQIDYFVKKFKIIEDYDKAHLKAAVYEMRLGEVAVRWENKKELRFHIDNEKLDCWDIFREQGGSFGFSSLDYIPTLIKTPILELPPNSLTFVTTIERFNLPRDIIARFNLKSKLVHKGLLLGTGPIVDPGFKSRIVIPLHNFSDSPILLEYKQGFINVEFTRTLDPDQHIIEDIPLSIVNNESAEIPVEVFFRNTKNVESSVYSALYKNEQLVSDANKAISRLTWGGAIAIFALIIGVFSLINSVFDNSNTANIQVHKTQALLSEISETNSSTIMQLKDELLKMSSELEQIRNDRSYEKIAALHNRINALEKELASVLDHDPNRKSTEEDRDAIN